jgi:hypothetical protein
MDLEKAVEASQSGDLKWLGDISLIPARDRNATLRTPPDERVQTRGSRQDGP